MLSAQVRMISVLMAFVRMMGQCRDIIIGTRQTKRAPIQLKTGIFERRLHGGSLVSAGSDFVQRFHLLLQVQHTTGELRSASKMHYDTLALLRTER
uniref:Putative secreted protein n=1 Tax=Anopheles darlingi TaxID=43151 RepID=A0A2M4D1W5_ANODA